MDDDVGRTAISPFVASMTTRIARHADAYSVEVERFRESAPRAVGAEERILEDLYAHVENILVSYEPPGVRRRGDSLTFQHLYTAVFERPSDADDETTGSLLGEVIEALVAAETEFRGPLSLSHVQRERLAQTYERLGSALSGALLPAHARMAFRRAAWLYGVNEDRDAQDRCELASARIRTTRIYPWWQRTAGRAADLLCGYGFHPFRLLGWIGVVLILSTVALVAIEGVSLTTALRLCVVSALAPLGADDQETLGSSGRALLVFESWLSVVATSVFFALLVRRWFRL
ncbi:hypothetical protein [Nocardia sp. bgisy134]|uniref:hypothetical protein n=1 Tax=Nocardia sp. bgisy134 TaxID=3413789 RepID=UPI003D740AE6